MHIKIPQRAYSHSSTGIAKSFCTATAAVANIAHTGVAVQLKCVTVLDSRTAAKESGSIYAQENFVKRAMYVFRRFTWYMSRALFLARTVSRFHTQKRLLTYITCVISI